MKKADTHRMLPKDQLTDHIDAAYHWLCHQRRHYPPDADIWHLRFHWSTQRLAILDALNAGEYVFSPLVCMTNRTGKTIHLWSAPDALVLKMLTRYLAPRLPLSPRCTHVKGHGGLKATVRSIQQHLPQYRFVLRTDVKGYYHHIDYHLMLNKLAEDIADKALLRLLWRSMNRCVDKGGVCREITRGIPRGCPLSPLLEAFFLTALDSHFEHIPKVFYVRYMDDILILAPTRWTLRQAVQQLNQILRAHKLAKHPDKTFIGRIEKGFDFLGYAFSRQGLRVAPKTWQHILARLRRLYEQKQTAPEGAVVLGDYVRRWCRWVFASLHDLLAPGFVFTLAIDTQTDEADTQ